MSNGGTKKPTHRLYVFHDDDHRTEVGAVWAHGKGGGFNITIKPGLLVGSESKLVAFEIDHERERERREERGNNDRRSSSGRGQR